jgi:hypothetical protein
MIFCCGGNASLLCSGILYLKRSNFNAISNRKYQSYAFVEPNAKTIFPSSSSP